MEQGTGKTLVAIKTIEYRAKVQGMKRFLIVVPNSIVYNWQLDLTKHLDLDYYLETLNYRQKSSKIEALNDFIMLDNRNMLLKDLQAKTSQKLSKTELLKDYEPPIQILVVNYEKLTTLPIRKFKPHMVIFDESHFMKNRTSKRTQEAKRIAKQASSVLQLTGTPIVQGLEDLWSQYNISSPEVFGEWKDFEARYCIKGGFKGKVIVGYQNEKEIQKILNKTSYRVRLRDCVDLPPLIEKTVYVELEKNKHYNEMYEQLLTTIELDKQLSRSYLKSVLRQHNIDYQSNISYTDLLLLVQDYLMTSSVELAVTKLIRLQQITGGFLTLDNGEIVQVGNEKIKATMELVEMIDKPILIYCQFIAEQEELYKVLHKNYRTRIFKGKDKDEVYQDFLDGKVDILIAPYQSGSVGLNLQRSHNIIMYSHTNSASDFSQTISRILRIGQKNKMVVHYIVMKGTVDQKILKNVKRKVDYSHKILDGGDKYASHT